MPTSWARAAWGDTRPLLTSMYRGVTGDFKIPEAVCAGHEPTITRIIDTRAPCAHRGDRGSAAARADAAWRYPRKDVGHAGRHVHRPARCQQTGRRGQSAQRRLGLGDDGVDA